MVESIIYRGKKRFYFYGIYGDFNHIKRHIKKYPKTRHYWEKMYIPIQGRTKYVLYLDRRIG